jgi:surface antigen
MGGLVSGLRITTRKRLYRATTSWRLRREGRAPACALAIVALGLCLGACSYPLGSLLENAQAKPGVPVAGSGKLPSDADLAYASAAAAAALAKGGKDLSAPWENPRTGARGTITPIDTAYSQEGSECRAFLASYVVENDAAWLHGEACRKDEGKWVVRSLKPWQRDKGNFT